MQDIGPNNCHRLVFKRAVLCGMLIAIFIASGVQAQHAWQQPNAPMPRGEVEKIIGDLNEAEPARDLRIVWVWGRDTAHGPGAHEYVRVRDAMVDLLRKVPRVTVETARGFPTRKQFETADLVVMFLHLPQLSDEDYAAFRAYIERGGGVVALHESAIMRPAEDGKKLAHCLGMAWDEGQSKWGALFEDVRVKTDHPIFKNFPENLPVPDEFYWELNHEKDVQVLGEVRVGPPADSKGPIDEQHLSEDRYPAFWSFEPGKGRVFGTTIGHNTFTYFDPRFRIILFRAMAWTMRESSDPFMPLVFEGITDEKGMVGATSDMRDAEVKAKAKQAAREETQADLREPEPAS